MHTVTGTGTGIWAIERKWLAFFLSVGNCLFPFPGTLHARPRHVGTTVE